MNTVQMYLIGLDIGSSSIKASVIDAESGICKGSAYHPKKEMKIEAAKPGWAEQDPEAWWTNLKMAVSELLDSTRIKGGDIGAIGISYQMHGLVAIDKNRKTLRPSIIWCDSRAVATGKRAFNELGKEQCLTHLLNSPGNFTASKLKWVKDNEPDLYKNIWKIMLPGDYIAMKLTGNVNTTVTGLSEGMFWDFKNNHTADLLLNHYGINQSLLPELTENFGEQGKVSPEASAELGIPAGIKITYRAGDQPNNAFSLNVLKPGEIAATAGTSGVVYGISSEIKYDPLSRVNTFAHVNHSSEAPRLGILLCINGTGILNSWLKHNIGDGLQYEQLNAMADKVPAGSEGLVVMPFGNGAERVLENKDTGSWFCNLNFNIHQRAHIFRAAQEGIAFSFQYGLDIMKEMGLRIERIRAGNANMFLSPVFRKTLSGVTGAVIELYDTDGAQGAARAAGIGAGYYKNFNEAFESFKILNITEPELNKQQVTDAYGNWSRYLKQLV